MAISPGEGPSRNNNSPIRKRPRITIRYRSRESGERHVVEAQDGCTNHEDRESNTEEERERQNEETREDAEEAEDADAEEEAVGVQEEEEEEEEESVESEEVYEVVDIEEEVASGGDGDGGRDGSISVTLTDQDILNCCICCEPLTTPVFQCENGHIACSTCCVRIAHKCHSCREPIGHIRCRAIEKVAESIKLSCRYARHGCIEKTTRINKSIHEKDCVYIPCWCPIDGCQFTAPSKTLSQHINHEHHGSFIDFHYDSYFYVKLGLNQKVVVLKELTDSNLFIITNRQERVGNMFHVFHIGPKSSAEMYQYELCARSQGSCLKVESFVNHSLGNNFPATTKFLLVPTDFQGPSSPAVKIEIRIYKVDESSTCG